MELGRRLGAGAAETGLVVPYQFNLMPAVMLLLTLSLPRSVTEVVTCSGP